jgi:hypothetical protein
MFRSTRAMTPLFSAFAAFCALAAHAAPPSYTLQPIQQTHPDLVAPVPGVMNNNGQIAGYAYSNNAVDQHLAWWNGATLTTTGDAPNEYLALIDMNDRGQVLGYTVDEERGVHGFIYQNGTYTSIPSFQYAYGINAAGKVPFWSQDMEGYFLWNNGNTTPLPMTATINGATHELSEPMGINDNDDVAYVAYDEMYGIPGLYVHGAAPFAITPPEQMLNATIIGINNNRQIAGELLTGTEQRKPFLYSDNGTRGNGTFQFFDADYRLMYLNGWHDLNDCIPTGWTVACTYDLNDRGEIAAMLINTEFQLQLAILKPSDTQSGNTLRGQVEMPNPSGKTLRVSITGTTTQNATATLDAQGRFSLPLTVTGAATIRLKAANTLTAKVNMTLANGENALSGSIALRGGDANDDNAIDITDLLQLIGAYNQVSPSAGYLASADFDNNGTNDIADLLLLIGNYNRVGE